MAHSDLETFSVPRTAEKDAVSLATRLHGARGFKLHESSSEHATCSIGNLFLYKMIGVLVTSDYTPPLQIEITRGQSEYAVTISSRSRAPFESLDKNSRFFADGARKARQIIER